MLDNEPLVYPSRTMERFPYDPGVPNRQLWAIGMIVVQWSMTEGLVDNSISSLIASDADLLQEFKARRQFQQKLALWESLLESRAPDYLKHRIASLLPTIKALSSQRDDVVHRGWGGGMEETGWRASMVSELLPTTDAGMLPKFGDKGIPPNKAPMRWRADFSRLRRMAREMAALNSQLFMATLLPPPHGDVDGAQIVP